MIPNMDPKQMQKLMNQMGIKSQEIDAEKVVIEKKDGTKLVVMQPSVIQIEMKGAKSFQVSGKVEEVVGKTAMEEDIELIVAQTGVSREKAGEALKECSGDIAEAILKLKEGK
ncbi:nascent polypeptide-associated complex protein [Candidatus Micrarchaeota archaeon]|nr:nascent polypeptide-associated complex protein [Candidatus Micrarchaeota archaeon]